MSVCVSEMTPAWASSAGTKTRRTEAATIPASASAAMPPYCADNNALTSAGPPDSNLFVVVYACFVAAMAPSGSHCSLQPAGPAGSATTIPMGRETGSYWKT